MEEVVVLIDPIPIGILAAAVGPEHSLPLEEVEEEVVVQVY
jgi:hypothetical protein